MRKVTKKRPHSEEKERKSIGNHKRSDRTAEKHGEREGQQKKRRKQSTAPVS
jgi:hypothetical protein